jgi:hypothetical protein
MSAARPVYCTPVHARPRPTPRTRLPRRAGVRSTGLALLTAATLVLTLLAFGPGVDADQPAGVAPDPPPGPAPVAVSAAVDMHALGRPVSQRYLGLAFEVSALPQIAQFGSEGDFAELLRSLGPGLLRFGGISADTRIAWTDAEKPKPAWASSSLTAADFTHLRTLAQRSGWTVLLTVGLAHYDPAAAAREVAAAKSALGPWLVGVEIGNEPDAYGAHGLRTQPWTFSRYNWEVGQYLRAIGRRVRGVPLAGPGVSGSRAFLRWGPREVRAQRPALLTGHHYPLGCRKLPPPSIEQLLSPRVRKLEGDSLLRYTRVARASGIPFRMDELGSVSCGGKAGISNAFAASLWATDYIAHSLQSGVAGINLEGNPAYCLGYSPVCAASPARLESGQLGAQPVWYALLMMRGLQGARPVRSVLSTPPAQNMAVSSFLAPDGSLRVVVVDDDPPGSAPAQVALRVGRRFRSASELVLSAPSPEATSGVRLGGRTVSADGSFNSAAGARPVALSGGVATVTVGPSSAALVTVAKG